MRLSCLVASTDASNVRQGCGSQFVESRCDAPITKTVDVAVGPALILAQRCQIRHRVAKQ